MMKRRWFVGVALCSTLLACGGVSSDSADPSGDVAAERENLNPDGADHAAVKATLGSETHSGDVSSRKNSRLESLAASQATTETTGVEEWALTGEEASRLRVAGVDASGATLSEFAVLLGNGDPTVVGREAMTKDDRARSDAFIRDMLEAIRKAEAEADGREEGTPESTLIEKGGGPVCTLCGASGVPVRTRCILVQKQCKDQKQCGHDANGVPIYQDCGSWWNCGGCVGVWW